MPSLHLSLWILSLSPLALACQFSPPRPERPNFIIILADDMGDAGLSCTGNPHFETPHLDRLAREGMRFTDFHSSGAVCSPTRAGLLTGRYQQRTGVVGVVNADPEHSDHGDALQLTELTFAEALKERGYSTGIFGKWHVGYAPEYSPIHQGFDEFRGFVSGNIDYHSHLDRMGTPDWWDGTQLIEEEGYTTHLINRHAVRFIEEHREGPFCLYLPHAAIHNPNQGPDDPPVRGPEKRPRSELSPIDEAVCKMTLALDEGVGEILAALEELELDERTLVIFLSDNGGTKENRSTGSAVRGLKGSLWEGGHLVPAIFRWPGKIPAGTTSAVAAISIDIMPTILALAGAGVPEGHTIDGVDLGPVLLEGASLPDRPLFWEFKSTAAMRNGQWKLVCTKEKSQLFHLGEDPGEENDVKGDHPDRLARMEVALDAWQREAHAGATIQPGRQEGAE